MNLISLFFIGFAMSTDAFAAAIGKGIAMRSPTWLTAIKTGLIFGVIESITPVIGWLLGQSAIGLVQEWDHWVALFILSLLGCHMIYNGLQNEPVAATNTEKTGFWGLALTGLATSIDAMAVGVGLAFLQVNIFLVALIIGCCTFVMVTAGVLLGQVLGQKVGQKAEIIGGLVLIAIGILIVIEHTRQAI
ncbi:Integral membrane protein [Methylophaga frappieri]|uniref:Putative manganese efflux pump MntP n=1 Tax=Methylophaga frappieri (strain ATCC BAA-2434 / DSM 25690 / JAM7) TaxID=754477 RepID=I1YL93_METFJ|nr:manganese efflux pump MntP family protein [Methylophaga frappieri]AFJ03686.1 Integral membrane protein [Methylophaga frappieri]